MITDLREFFRSWWNGCYIIEAKLADLGAPWLVCDAVPWILGAHVALYLGHLSGWDPNGHEDV